MKRITLSILSLILTLSCFSQKSDANLEILFDQTLWDWDGFGVNYVETRHTRDYSVFPQDYGGFKYLSEQDRQKVMDMIFGPEGLKPGIIKAFSDPFHEPVNDNNNPYVMDMDKFDHTTTTQWMLYFCREAEKRVKDWDGELVYLAGLYGPPGWMSRQKSFRGRDIDPAYYTEMAEYIVSWAKYLRDTEGFNVKYISMHNEGDDARRYTDGGYDDTTMYHHDFNMLWPPDQIVRFLKEAEKVLYHNDMLDIGLSCGETTTWERLHSNWYYGRRYMGNIAKEISDDAEAMANLGLITSHGFLNKYDSKGVDILREKNPDLHAWTTSYTWDPMDHSIIEDARNLIYGVKCNALIPWATIHNAYESDKLHPPMTFRISSNACSPFLTDDGNLTITKAYYYFKQISRAGQPHMKVARVKTDHDSLQCIAFEKAYTDHPDAFVVINKSGQSIEADISLSGTDHETFHAYRTSDKESGDENYKPTGKFTVKHNKISYTAPAYSVTTFEGSSKP